jgi:hypothetical protein
VANALGRTAVRRPLNNTVEVVRVLGMFQAPKSSSVAKHPEADELTDVLTRPPVQRIGVRLNNTSVVRLSVRFRRGCFSEQRAITHT